MTAQEIDAGFMHMIDAAIDNEDDVAAAVLDLARQYFANEDFKRRIKDEVRAINQASLAPCG